MSHVERAYERVIAAGWDVDSKGCWISRLRTGSQGYPLVNTLGSRAERRTFGAHRVVHLVVSRAETAPPVVRHTCDNRACVRPDHLVGGTQAQNLADMAQRDRSCFGVRQHLHKLTDKEVVEIRTAYASGGGCRGLLTRLARQYGVHRTTVANAVHGRTWQRAA